MFVDDNSARYEDQTYLLNEDRWVEVIVGIFPQKMRAACQHLSIGRIWGKLRGLISAIVPNLFQELTGVLAAKSDVLTGVLAAKSDVLTGVSGAKSDVLTGVLAAKSDVLWFFSKFLRIS